MRVDKRLKERLPWFLTHLPVSNALAHLKVVAKELQEAETTKKLIETVFMPRRPLRFWRSQSRPKEFHICFDVAIKNIRRVRVYEDHDRIFDSGVLNVGVDSMKNQILRRSDYVIPTSRFRLEVEDHYGNVFEKGIPENDTIVGNAFDRDLLLDLKGKIVNCHRLTLGEVDYRHLDRVYPPYHDQRTEPDYFYEQRMQKYLYYLVKKGVIFASVFKYLTVEPMIEGFWRQLAEQDVSLQDSKYMSTKEENSAYFLVSANLESLPTNVHWGRDELQKLTNAMSPSKKFEYIVAGEASTLEDALQLGQETLEATLTPTTSDHVLVSDDRDGEGSGTIAESLKSSDTVSGDASGSYEDIIQASDTIQLDGVGDVSDSLKTDDSVEGSGVLEEEAPLVISDSVDYALDTTIVEPLAASDDYDLSVDGVASDSLRVSDSVVGDSAVTSTDGIVASDSAPGGGSGTFSDGLRASDGGSYSYAGYIRVFDTDSDFNQMTRNGTIISGTGTGAVLTVDDPTLGNSGAKRPTSVQNVDYSNCSSIGYWYNLRNALGDCDGTGARADTPAQTCYTDILRLSGFSFGVPSNATITGIEVAISRKQSGTVNRVDQLIRVNVSGINSNNKADTSTYWPQSYSTKTYGGSSDLWGLSNVTPSNINTLYLDISAKDNYSSAGATFSVDCVWVKVYWRVLSSGTAFYTLSGSDVGVGNNLGQIQVSCSIPEGSISYTVKKNGSTVRSGSLASGKNTIDLTGVTASSASDSFEFVFSITSGASNKPTIDYIKHYLTASKSF